MNRYEALGMLINAQAALQAVINDGSMLIDSAMKQELDTDSEFAIINVHYQCIELEKKL